MPNMSPLLKTINSGISEGSVGEGVEDRATMPGNDMSINQNAELQSVAREEQICKNINENQLKALIQRREKRQKQIDKTVKHKSSRSRSRLSRDGKSPSFKKEIAFKRTKFVVP